jgi:hypothetical protein
MQAAYHEPIDPPIGDKSFKSILYRKLTGSGARRNARRDSDAAEGLRSFVGAAGLRILG